MLQLIPIWHADHLDSRDEVKKGFIGSRKLRTFYAWNADFVLKPAEFGPHWFELTVRLFRFLRVPLSEALVEYGGRGRAEEGSEKDEKGEGEEGVSEGTLEEWRGGPAGLIVEWRPEEGV